jgi:hypothetical protein
LLAGAFDGLVLPLLAAASVAALIRYAANPQTWAGILMSFALAGFAYLVVLYKTGARSEEAAFLRELLAFPLIVLRRR